MIRYFTSSQVAIARETRNILCADLSQNHTARELAERFQVAETSLKNYFRGVFGENLSTFLREARMRRAAELLQSSELRVAEIAAQVGYENQSKFAAVFVRRFAARRWSIGAGHGFRLLMTIKSNVFCLLIQKEAHSFVSGTVGFSHFYCTKNYGLAPLNCHWALSLWSSTMCRNRPPSAISSCGEPCCATFPSFSTTM